MSSRPGTHRALEKTILFEAIPDAVLSICTSGLILDAQIPPENVLPFSSEDVRDHYVQELMPDMYSTVFLEHLEESHETGRVRARKYFLEGSNALVAVEVRFIPGLNDEVLVMVRDTRQKQRLDADILEAVDRERRRIGLDLHDSLGQQLAGLSYMSSRLLRKLRAAEPHSLALAEQIKHEIQRAIEHTSAIVRGLNPAELDEGFLYAVVELACHVEAVYGITCHVEHRGSIRVSNSIVAYHLYRIVQEAVNNAAKHAETDRIDINMTTEDDHLVLSIWDRGHGFVLHERENSGMGLDTMRYRATMIGAFLQLHSAPGEGTMVTCRLPLQTATECELLL